MPYFRPKWSKLIPYFRPKRLKKAYPLVRHFFNSLYKGLLPGAKSALRIMSLAAYVSETNNQSFT